MCRDNTNLEANFAFRKIDDKEEIQKLKSKFVIIFESSKPIYQIIARRNFVAADRSRVYEGEDGGYVTNKKFVDPYDGSWIDKDSIVDGENIEITRSCLYQTNVFGKHMDIMHSDISNSVIINKVNFEDRWMHIISSDIHGSNIKNNNYNKTTHIYQSKISTSTIGAGCSLINVNIDGSTVSNCKLKYIKVNDSHLLNINFTPDPVIDGMMKNRLTETPLMIYPLREYNNTILISPNFVGELRLMMKYNGDTPEDPLNIIGPTKYGEKLLKFVKRHFKDISKKNKRKDIIYDNIISDNKEE